MAWLVVLVPIVAGAGVWVGGAARRRRGAPLAGPLGVGAVGAVVATLVLAGIAAAVGAASEVAWGGGLVLRLSADGVAGVIAVLVSGVAAAVVGYASVHEDETGLPRLLGLLTVFVGSMELLVLADDLLTLVVAWELVGALSWALIGYAWDDVSNPQRAAHAFNATRFGGIGLFLAAGAAFAGTGSVAYGALGGLSGPLLDWVAAGVLLAAAAKSAQVPFAPWLYSAMAGPTPVSALLHSATMVAAGAYVLIRLEPALAATGWFGPAAIAIGLVTALAGGVAAAVENHGKRVLAASTSAQYGLMFVAVGAGAAGAAAAHLVAHALFKALLFLGVGIGMHAVGDPDIRRMRLGRGLPRAAAAFAVGSLALGAVPPLGGAWTKDAVVAAAFHDGSWIGVGTLAAGLLSAIYATRLYVLAFGTAGQPAVDTDRIHRPGRVELGAVGALALASLALGLLWLPGASAFVERLTDSAVVEGNVLELAASVGLIAVAVLWVVGQDRRTGTITFGLPETVRAGAADWFRLPALTRSLVVDPFLATCHALARFDDVAVDGAVRAVARAARAVSALLSRWGELGVDGVVQAVAGTTLRASRTSATTDDRAVDGAVEGLARGVGDTGRWTRGLQTGLAHQYYLLMTIGVVVLAIAVAVWR